MASGRNAIIRRHKRKPYTDRPAERVKYLHLGPDNDVIERAAVIRNHGHHGEFLPGDLGQDVERKHPSGVIRFTPSLIVGIPAIRVLVYPDCHRMVLQRMVYRRLGKRVAREFV